MKQKIAIKVQVRCDKCRSKAMKIAAAEDGVISVALEGDNKDKVVVTGDGVDAANLAIRLSKKLGRARLESVEQVEQQKPAVKNENKDTKPTPSSTLYASTSSCQQSQCELYEVVYDPYPSTCTIM